jgi:hypothetical protein
VSAAQPSSPECQADVPPLSCGLLARLRDSSSPFRDVPFDYGEIALRWGWRSGDEKKTRLPFAALHDRQRVAAFMVVIGPPRLSGTT